MDDDIAVIGIGCRFPGADNIDEFWRVLVNGENHVVDIPPERWNNDAFYSENRNEPGKLYVKKAAFINRHDEWDNRLFGISDNEAARVDPQQRYVLECVHMAMEDSGITRMQLQGSETGVFIGAMNGDYASLSDFDHDGDTNYSATGGSNTVISARVSYVYNLQGPSMVIDTACSSSMTAIHLGCQAIRSGDCEMALCGGVSSILSPGLFVTLCRAKMLSPTNQCQAFCDTADGYVRGEGCGIVFLKSYKKAIEDRNKIWGILKTGVNQDGQMAQPLTAPAGKQQEKLLRKIYTRYNISPLDLQYIECHGTGTPVGDPTEVNAFGNFIKTYREQNDKCSDKSEAININVNEKDPEKERLVEERSDTRQFLPNQKDILIGSVKTNIGHLESAAGMAALIKVLLMMEKGKFVPSLHVRKDKSNINKKIMFEGYGLDVSVDVSDWPPNADGQRVCCVNSFGFGGSNSHAVVIQKTSNQAVTTEDLSNEMKVINISALDKTALKLSLLTLKEDISSGLYNIQDVSFTSFFHREQFATKTLVYGRNIDEVRRTISQKLHDIDKLEIPKKLQYIFVFCGVGTAWKGMCKEMMETQPVFRSTVAAIDDILEPLAGYRMADKFRKHTDYSDPFLNHVAIFCTQVALLKLWQSWGINPKVIIGQSVGEVAAAYASGALTLNNAIQVIFHRSKCLAQQTGGCMMVVGNYNLGKLEKLCTKYDKRVVIAVFNSPLSCTLSGDTDVMAKIKSELEALNERENAGILIKVISVQCAYHSQHVDPCLDEIRRKLQDIKSGRREIPQISTVTGELAGESDFHTSNYWANNIRKPVRFMQAVHGVLEKDVTNVFVEIGPRQVLRLHLKNIVDNVYKGICLPSMNVKKENDCIYASLSTLQEYGAMINWQNIIQSFGNVVAIPRYIGKTTNSLYIPQKHQTLLKGISRDREVHMYVRGESGKVFFQIDKESTPFVYDHYFYNVVLVPGAIYIEAAFAIGQRITELNAFEIAVSAEFENTLMPQGNNQYLVDVQIENDVGSKQRLFVARNEGKTLCRGTISQRPKSQRKWLDVYPIKERCAKYKTQDECYAFSEQFPFKYGDSLRIMRQAWATDTECLVEFELEDSVKSQCKSTHFHPCIIDGLFQTVAILMKRDRSNSSPVLPKGVDSVVINRPQQSKMFAYTQLLRRTDIGSHYNFLLITPDGHVIAEIENFYIQTMGVPSTLDRISFKINWRQVTISDFNKDNNEGHVVVFGTKRFIECYKATEVNDNSFVSISISDNNFNEDSFGNTISKYANSLRAIVFAPCYNIQHVLPSEIRIYQAAKEMFLVLRQLLTFVQENTSSLNVPLYVVTENTIASDKHNISASNICGSEVWGMVRSSVLETAFDNLVLLDMELTTENMANLQKIVRSMVKNVKEYLLNCGQVFCSEILEYNESKHATAVNTEINLDTFDYAALKTSNPAVAKNLYFELCQSSQGEGKRSTQEYSVRLHSFCLHDPSLFPISPVLLDTEEIIWPEDDSKGFQMMCLEGIGWEEDKFLSGTNPTNPTVGFCFPTDVKTVVRIPSQYTFNPECFSKYIPGMMSVAVIILKIVESCEPASNVCVVVDNDSNSWLQLIRSLFSNLSSSTVHVEQKDSVSGATDKSDAQTVVILSNVTHKHIEKLHFRFPGLQKVVSLEQYLPMYMKIWIEHEISDVETDVLRTENIFTSSELPEKVKTVTEILQSSTKFENITQTEESEHTKVQKEEHRADILHLPFPVLTVLEGKKSTGKVPLKVPCNGIFRKNGCYILVGGLTGLGWELLQLLAELGAGYIATLSRRKPTGDRMQDIKNIMKKFNCTVLPIQADITKLDELRSAIGEIRSKIGNKHIKGIFHGGGVTADKLLKNMTDTDVDTPLLPKILGTWNLHTVAEDMNLDFFVMHSSVAGVIGNAGQCNYAAGNTFQDAVAHYRKSHGLCGTSINWSALSLGMAKEKAELETFLKNQGFNYLSLEDIRNCFMQSLTCHLSQVMFGRFDWEKFRLHPIVKMFPHKFSKILSKYEKATTKNLEKKSHFDIDDYHNSHPKDKKNMVFELLKMTIGDTFVFDDTVITEETNFVSLGIDSMAAMSFINFVFEATQVRIPEGKLFADSATVATLIAYIIEHIPKQLGFKNKSVGEENKKLLQYLQGDITFMQKMVLDDMKKHNGGNFIYQIDIEIFGEIFTLQGWKTVVNHIVKMNPDLRRVYRAKDDGTYQSTLIGKNDVNVDISQVEFDSICQDNTVDKRNHVYFDLTKELPLKFQYACQNDKTRLRLYIHSVACDLSGVTLLFTDLKLYFKSFHTNQSLPEKNTDIDLADDVRCTRALLHPETKLYWKDQFNSDIRPFTFGASLSEKQNEDDFKEITVSLPMSKVERVLAYVQEKGLSVYTFVTAAYLVTLRQMTKMDVIPLLNVTDMRSHIPKLNSYITRGGNLVPFIGDMRNMGNVGDFLKRISDGLSMMTRHSIYPFELIKDEIHSEELKTHISRHLLAADNMTNVNKILKDRNVSVKSIVHRRCYYETVMIIVYDLLQKEIYLTLGYNSKALKDGEAKLIPMSVFDLMEAFMTQENLDVGEILIGNDFPMSRGTLSDKEVTNYLEQHKKSESKLQTNMMSMEMKVEKITGFKETVSDEQLKKAKDDDESQTILYEGCFKQHSSDGCEQDVTLLLLKETYSSGSEDVALSWRAEENWSERKLSVHKISDVKFQEKEGSFYIMLKSHSRWFIFKSYSEEKALTLIAKLREAVSEQKTIYKDKKRASIPRLV